jgi:hypothetical protein
MDRQRGRCRLPVAVAPQLPWIAMANPKHEEILNHGVAAWNTWRKENPLVRPDLSGNLLQHQLRFDMRYGTRDLMDWMSGTEEARMCSQALKDDSIYYDPYWEDCWELSG